jgi:hypothetical protein
VAWTRELSVDWTSGVWTWEDHETPSDGEGGYEDLNEEGGRSDVQAIGMFLSGVEMPVLGVGRGEGRLSERFNGQDPLWEPPMTGIGA